MAKRKKVPRYLHHQKTNQGYARFTTTENGESKRVTRYFGEYNTPESIQAYREFLEEIGAQDAPEPTPEHRHHSYSLDECILAYQEHSWDFYGEGRTSEAPRIKLTLDRLREVHQHTNINTFTGRDLKKFQQHLVDLGQSRQYVNTQVKRVLRFFRWLVGEDYCEPSVLQKLEAVPHLRKGKTTAKESKKVHACSQEDFEAVLPFLNPVIRAMVTVQRYTGMRPIEVCDICPAHIDRSEEVWFFIPPDHKTAHKGKTLIKAIPKPAREALQPYLDRDDNAYCFSPLEAVKAMGRNSDQKRRKKPLGNKYTTSSYQHGVAYGFKKAEKQGVTLVKWSPIQLRKLAATELRQVAGLEAAKDWLGHADSKVTEEHYADLTQEQLREITAKLEEHWGQDTKEPPPES